MTRRIDRIATVVLSLFVGLQAIIPAWGLMADGSVYGFKMPESWLTSAWPFEGYFVAGLVLLVVVAGGCLLTAAINVMSPRFGPLAALLMGLVLIGWIGGELVFLNQTMVMTWIILACGLGLVLLAAPYVMPAQRSRVTVS
ncbi:MAG TPA: hypothetical protein VFB69_06765 [Candidatus Dormibacteraeota bacterium]|nr:hypothetical protein [Candidatus Dormibacteraeota bacterium]